MGVLIVGRFLKMTKPINQDGSYIYCPKCNSPDIYRWFCGEYTCYGCHELFGVCEEIQKFTQLTQRRMG